MEKPFKINFDKYGHCVVCSLNMITDRVIDGEVVQMFTTKKDTLYTILSDGSEMRVCICKDCKKLVNEHDFKYIMKKVYKGWEMESAGLVMRRHMNKMTNKAWDKEHRDKYLERMGKLEIISDIEGKSESWILKRIKKHKKDKEKDK